MSGSKIVVKVSLGTLAAGNAKSARDYQLRRKAS